MRPYEKIETLFVRDEDFNVTDELKRPVIASINKWIVTEKVDGTNMRISFLRDPDDQVTYVIQGRTDRASVPPQLYNHCDELARRLLPEITISMVQRELNSYTLYGEGYG